MKHTGARSAGTCIATISRMAQSAETSGSQKAHDNFFELLSKFDNAMLVTQSGPAGSLHARPMAIAETGTDGSLWFITGADTLKIDEIQAHEQVLAVLQNQKQWLSISGRAELDRDRAHVQKVWTESFRVWFDGPDDPNIVLIHLRPSEAEYWDLSGVKKGLKFALQYANAYVSGKPLRGPQDPDTHAKIQM